jgi:hypothetical protein
VLPGRAAYFIVIRATTQMRIALVGGAPQALSAEQMLATTGLRASKRYLATRVDNLPVPVFNRPLWGVISGTLVRADVARLAAGDRQHQWPRPGERVWVPHLMVRTLNIGHSTARGRSCSKKPIIRLPAHSTAKHPA